MQAKALERTLPLLTPFSEAALDHITRALRAANLLPLGGRGKNAPHITAQHAATVLIAAAVADKPQEAPAAVTLYAPLTPANGEQFGFAGCKTFGEAFEAILSDPEWKLGVADVAINVTWPLVSIALKDGRKFDYGYGDYAAAKAAGFKTSPSRLVFHYAPGTLSQIALDLVPDEQGERGAK